MYQAHVVILESRCFPDITEQWYNLAISALTQQGITFSRVTVPHTTNLPLAYRMLLEATVTQKNTSLRVPDGYLVLGLNYKGDMPETNHYNLWSHLQQLSTETDIPFSSVLEYEQEGGDLAHAATKYSGKINLAVQSLVTLMTLRHQLYASPLTKAA